MRLGSSIREVISSQGFLNTLEDFRAQETTYEIG